jgi:hypothetical protein
MSSSTDYSQFYNDYSTQRKVLKQYENNLVNRIKPANLDVINQKIDLSDARKKDSEIYLLQENYMYILGTITFAIVFVGAIVIIKK